MIKHFPILDGRAYVVELPEGAHSPLIGGVNVLCELTYIDEWGYDYCSFRLPPGSWQIVGLLPEVTEEQADELVEWVETGQYYVDYRVDGWWNGDITALESLESAIRAEGWYFENPFGDEPAEDDYSFFTDSNVTLKEAWQQAQSRVLCRERCLILKRN